MNEQNKVAVVTGGAQGIGYQIAKRLFSDGFKLAIVDFNGEGANQAAHALSQDDSKVIAIKADVSNRDDVFNAMNQTVEHFGDLHVLVSNAGLGPMTPIDSITPEDFDKVYGVNVKGVLWGIQAAHAQFKQLGHGGKIINATSQAGVEGNAGFSLYSSSKFAVRGLTQVAARDLAHESITVNAFAPGIVHTPMMEGIAKKQLKKLANLNLGDGNNLLIKLL